VLEELLVRNEQLNEVGPRIKPALNLCEDLVNVLHDDCLVLSVII